MSKRFMILFSVLILSLSVFGGILFFSDGNKNHFTKIAPPPQWSAYQTVSNANLILPDNQYQIDTPIVNSSFNLTSTQQVFLPIHSPSSAPYLTVSYIEPSFWLGWGMKISKPENNKLLQRYIESYQKTYTQDRAKEGLQVQWNSAKPIGMEQMSTPMKIVGLNLVLYLEGTLLTTEGQAFIHQHYCWIEKDKLYLISFLYPKPLEKQTQPVVDQIVVTLTFDK